MVMANIAEAIEKDMANYIPSGSSAGSFVLSGNALVGSFISSEDLQCVFGSASPYPKHMSFEDWRYAIEERLQRLEENYIQSEGIVRTHCEWCDSNSATTKRGCCWACGAPKPKNKKGTDFYRTVTEKIWLSDGCGRPSKIVKSAISVFFKDGTVCSTTSLRGKIQLEHGRNEEVQIVYMTLDENYEKSTDTFGTWIKDIEEIEPAEWDEDYDQFNISNNTKQQLVRTLKNFIGNK